MLISISSTIRLRLESPILRQRMPSCARGHGRPWRTCIRRGRSKRSIGVSNYEIKHLQMLLSECRVRPAVNQVEYHPLLLRTALREFCAKEGIAFEAYSSLAKNNPKLMNNATVMDVATRLGKSVAQVLLRWALQHGAIIIPKSVDRKRMADNVAVFDFALSDDDMRSLDALDSNWHCTWTSHNVY
eukprot:Opistho-2@37404